MLKVNGQGSLRNVCLRELGINAASFNENNPTKEQICYFKCVGQKEGILDANGHHVSSFRNNPNRSPKVDECLKISADDICEQVYKQYVCMYRSK